MTALALSDPLRPQPPGGTASGAALSVLAHAVLVLALAYGVAWRVPAPQAMSAELWAAVPQTAAPPEPAPVPPPPATPEPQPAPAPEPPRAVKAEPPPVTPPREADIAVERERLRKEQAEKAAAQAQKLERARLEQEKAEKAKAAAREKAEKAEKAAKAQKEQKAEKERLAREEREAKAEAERIARQREENLKRLMGQVASGPAGSRGTAAADAAPTANYRGLLVRAIKPNIVFADALPGNPAAEVEVRAAPGGAIIGRRLVTSSGHKEWDEAVLRAIDRTGTLPRDTDGRVPATLVISFRPRD